jgi:Holliday junction resolvasome RuvABC endonuclease subunit
MTNLNIAGLDLSITATGICDVNGVTSTHGGDAKLGDRRLCKIQLAIASIADDVDLMMIEDLPRSGMGGATTGMVQGVARCLLTGMGIPYILIIPSKLKVYATGNGNATKSDMRMSLYQRYGIDERDDNRADAWWLRALGLDLYDQPLTQANGNVHLPQSHRRALDKLVKVEPRIWA